AALLAGEVQAGWSGIPNVASHIKSGRLKVFAISTARRSASLPDVPTAIEQGYPDFDIATVIGLQAPAGAPREVVTRLQAAVAKILRERETAERMTNLGMELMENGTEHYVRFARQDLERYAQAVKAAGVRGARRPRADGRQLERARHQHCRQPERHLSPAARFRAGHRARRRAIGADRASFAARRVAAGIRRARQVEAGNARLRLGRRRLRSEERRVGKWCGSRW